MKTNFKPKGKVLLGAELTPENFGLDTTGFVPRTTAKERLETALNVALMTVSVAAGTYLVIAALVN